MKRQQETGGNGFEALGLAMDRRSLEKLENVFPEIAQAIRVLVDGGAEPAEIRRFALRRRGSADWANWLEAAARGAQAQAEGS